MPTLKLGYPEHEHCTLRDSLVFFLGIYEMLTSGATVNQKMFVLQILIFVLKEFHRSGRATKNF